MKRNFLIALPLSLLFLIGLLNLGEGRKAAATQKSAEVSPQAAGVEIQVEKVPPPKRERTVQQDNTPELIEKLPEKSRSCMDCHGEKELEPSTEAGKQYKLYVQIAPLLESVHKDNECADCHSGADREENPHHDGGPKTALSCGECHDQAWKDFTTTDAHGKAFNAKNPRAPFCNDCHGGHDIMPLKSPQSNLTPATQPESCGRCHGSEELNLEDGITKRRLIERYYTSIHWQSISVGRPAATCSDCHGHHTILRSSDQKSTVANLNVMNTCSKCHPNAVQVFIRGSHGRALLRGNHDVPNCITCHGDHDIMSLKIQSGGKRDFAATQICIWCHGNERMMARYSLDTAPVESYLKDFHGLTQRGSLGTSATCADCHDAHNSLPSSHHESTMHITNRGTTCGKCHGQSSDSFIMSFTHRKFAPDEFGGKVNKLVRQLYILLIILVVGGMLLHNFIMWRHSYIRKKRYQQKHGTVLRMNTIERRWHMWLFISFTILALSGFMLKFPHSFVFSWLYDIGITEPIRAWIHRISAIVMTVGMALFFLYQLTPRGRQKWIYGMIPRLQDFKDFINTMKYYLGLSKQRPRFKIFNYMEKAEYLALLWGTAIMLVTGLLLWFPRSLPSHWPAWLIEVGRTIHFYEAILAVLSILVWHLFHTMFHPSEYPMDTAWLTGVLTEEEARHRFDDETVKAQIPPKKEEELPPPEAPAPWEKEEHPETVEEPPPEKKEE